MGEIDLINNEPAPSSVSGSGSVLVDRTARQSIEIQGWAADPVAGPIRDLFVVIDGASRLPARYGLDRPDIAALAPHGNRDRFVGFYAIFATSLLGPGRHDITFLAVPADGISYVIVPEERLTIGFSSQISRTAAGQRRRHQLRHDLQYRNRAPLSLGRAPLGVSPRRCTANRPT